MSGQGSEEWLRVEALFDAAWEQPVDERIDWLASSGESAEVVARVMALIQAAADSGDFLEDAGAVPIDRHAVGLAAGCRIGAWRIEQLIGRGGMGEVYAVERDDGQFAQRAALKVIAHSRSALWGRFQSERQILANLDHPDIARLIDGGLLDDGRPYMVMEFVDGKPIDRYCDAHALDLPGRVGLIIQACDALAHAHGQLVVHSDLKPSNLLVGGDGRVRLIDFGVAHLVDNADPGHRSVALSPDYAAPEQLGHGAVSVATDTYGLAAILYRLVAGVPPRQVADRPATIALASILSSDPVRLADSANARAWCKTAAGTALIDDLDAILRKGLHRDARHRYATAHAFRVDLVAACERGVVDARRDDHRHVVRRTLYRHRRAVAVGAVIVASLSMGLGMAMWQAGEANRQRDESLREQARLEAVRQSIFHMFRSAGELRGGEATAADVLDNAARRIEDEFARDPARGAPILHALGELYFLITDYEAAAPLLRRLAETDPTVVDPALIAAGRYDLAQVMFRQGDTGYATELLGHAQGFWQRDPTRWESRLVDSRLLEAQLLRTHGDVEAAIALLRKARDRRLAISGDAHRDTGIFHNNLGVALFGIGELEQAREAFRAATAVWSRAGLEQSPDALNTLNNWGAVEVADGQIDAAETLLREATVLRRRYYGPSAATAALLGNYGKLLLQSGRAGEALPILREAAGMGSQYAGHGSVHHISALSGVAEAELAQADVAQAERSAETALTAAVDTLGIDHPATGIASLALARIRAEQQRPADALRLLDEADRIANAAGASGARLSAHAASIRASYALQAADSALGTATPSP